MSVYATPEQAVSLDQWAGLAEQLGLTQAQAAAVMRLCKALTDARSMPPDRALSVPLGSLLLLLWMQWAHVELGETGPVGVQRAQAVSGEVWPSLLRPPAAVASAALVDAN